MERGRMSDSSWQVFDIDAIRDSLTGDAVSYKEFLRVPSLSCGVYRLPAGAKDMQTPHDEDEVYFVLDGRARMKVGDEMKEVSAGNILYVRATETHSFFEIEEDMTLLVFFASAVT
jgi:mannose-6-phosphate isomerase-like protein (cupin superfamily)